MKRYFGISSHPLYYTLQSMKGRCYSQSHLSYKDYGGRGISVCDEWLDDPYTFFTWALAHGWESSLEIDRKEVNGNYNPDNCRVVTRTVNAKTHRKRVDNQSGYIGVTPHKQSSKFYASVTVNKKQRALGLHLTALKAAQIRDAYVIKHNLGLTLNGV